MGVEAGIVVLKRLVDQDRWEAALRAVESECKLRGVPVKRRPLTITQDFVNWLEATEECNFGTTDTDVEALSEAVDANHKSVVSLGAAIDGMRKLPSVDGA